MFYRTSAAALVLSLLIAVASIAETEPQAPPNDNLDNPELITPVDVIIGQNSWISRRELRYIDNERDWVELWTRHAPPVDDSDEGQDQDDDTPPEVDFGAHGVVSVVSGLTRNARAAHVHAIKRAGDELIVHYEIEADRDTRTGGYFSVTCFAVIPKQDVTPTKVLFKERVYGSEDESYALVETPPVRAFGTEFARAVVFLVEVTESMSESDRDFVAKELRQAIDAMDVGVMTGVVVYDSRWRGALFGGPELMPMHPTNRAIARQGIASTLKRGGESEHHAHDTIRQLLGWMPPVLEELVLIARTAPADTDELENDLARWLSTRFRNCSFTAVQIGDDEDAAKSLGRIADATGGRHVKVDPTE